jgi:hypothetical protein
MSQNPAARDGTAASDLAFNKSLTLRWCVVGFLTYGAHFLQGTEWVYRLCRYAAIARSIQLATAPFGFLGALKLCYPLVMLSPFLPGPVQLPYLVGVAVFVANVAEPLKTWILYDGPPDLIATKLNMGLWCLLCYGAVLISCFQAWHVPRYTLWLSLFAWRIIFSQPMLMLGPAAYLVYRSVVSSPRRYPSFFSIAEPNQI